MIQDGVVFAAGHESEASEIGENGPRAILTIEPEQRVCWWNLVRGEIPTNGRQALTQFLSVATVAAIAKRAEPVETVGLADDRAGTHHLPPLAPGVARSTHVIQPPKRRGQVFGLGQGALTGGLTGAIKIKDDPLTACSIDQVPGLPLVGERTAEQIIEKERAESFDRRLGEIRQKAREG